ncbi:MAG: flavodoxin [Bacteroidales bacterium]
MKKALLIYWPKGGNVEYAAGKIADLAGEEVEVKTTLLTDVTAELLQSYTNLIVGGSTVGSHVWEEASDSYKWGDFFKLLDQVDLKNKVVAFFGLGDQILYPNHFVDGLGIFEEQFSKRGANITGRWPVEGYQFTESEGVKDGMFFGLALDEDHQSELTEERIKNWLKQISADFR